MRLGSISDVSVSPSVEISSCITVGVLSFPVPGSRRSEKFCQLHREFAGKVKVLVYLPFLLQCWRQKQFGPCFLTVVVGT